MSTPTIIGDEAQSLQRRASEFFNELQALLMKHEVQLIAEPVIQNGLIVALPKIIDARKHEGQANGDGESSA